MQSEEQEAAKVEFKRNVKIGIISGLISTVVFIYLLDPVLKLITFLLTHVFSALFHTYVDRLFEQAAVLSGPDPGFDVLFLLLGLIAGLLNGASIVVFWPEKKRASEPKRVKHRVISFLPDVVLLLVLNMLFVLVAFGVLYSTMFELRIVSSFNQHLTAISPYVSDQELKMFRSRWTQMTSERDYLVIYSDLNRIAATNSVRLPENKMYSFFSL